MNELKILSMLILMAFVGACTSIKSVNQLGEDAYMLDKNEWEGTWVAGEGSLQLKIVDTKSSKIEVMFIENGEIQKYSVYVKQNGKDSYMNLVDEDNHYIFAKFKKMKNQVFIWLPSEESLKRAVDSKELAWVINENEDMLIKSDKNSFNKYFVENKREMLFEYETPTVFRKLVE